MCDKLPFLCSVVEAILVLCMQSGWLIRENFCLPLCQRFAISFGRKNATYGIANGIRVSASRWPRLEVRVVRLKCPYVLQSVWLVLLMICSVYQFIFYGTVYVQCMSSWTLVWRVLHAARAMHMQWVCWEIWNSHLWLLVLECIDYYNWGNHYLSLSLSPHSLLSGTMFEPQR